MLTTTMKDAISDFGCATGDLAKRFGSGTSRVAKRVGRRTTDLVDDIGPARALIGLAVIGAAIAGTVLLVRYVRTKRAEQLVDVEPVDPMTGGTAGVTHRGKHSHAHAH
jgi:hypothetical protein